MGGSGGGVLINNPSLFFTRVFSVNYYCNFARLGWRSSLLHRAQFQNQDCEIVYLRNDGVKENLSERHRRGLSYLLSRTYGGQRAASGTFRLTPSSSKKGKKSHLLFACCPRPQKNMPPVISRNQLYLENIMN